MELITSRDNDKIKEYIKLNSGKRARKKLSLFSLEGMRLCNEALDSGIIPEYAFADGPENGLVPRLSELGVPVYQITESLERAIADTAGPQGIYFVCRELPQMSADALESKTKLLCLYGLQDPGNTGTLIRTAEAFGFQGVVLSSDCCDLFSSKTLRAAMGSVFRMPYRIVDDMALFDQQMRALGKVSAASVVGRAELAAGYCNLPEIHLLYIGNEGNGLPKAFSDQCSLRITLPMKGKTESLNAAVAAGILMWEIGKQTEGESL